MRQLLMAIAMLGMMACQSKMQEKGTGTTTAAVSIEATKEEPGDTLLPGSDRDEHGCIPSAGYTWSEARQTCVRIWEDGITLQAQGATATGEKAYLFLSDDQLKAEIFLPNTITPVMLQRKGKEGAHYWEGGNFKLYPWKGYVLKENDKAIFAGE